MKNLFKFILCALVAGGTFTACSTDDSATTGQTANMTVRLVDGPGDFAEVLIDVQAVEVIIDGEIVLLDTNAGVYDLLLLTGGEFATLVNEEIPSGELSQMRLILGTENSVVLGSGDTISLKTPSAQQSGLKLNVNYNLQAGFTYEFILDFKVDESIVNLGNSNYLLKPVIRVTTSAESGAIAGSVSPADLPAVVTATNNEDDTIVITANTNTETGAFLLYGVPAGIYNVVIEPEAGSGYSTVNVENVEVTVENTTTLDAVVFE